MTDIGTWLAERKRIHAAATEESDGKEWLAARYTLVAGDDPGDPDEIIGDIRRRQYATAIADAHNHLPAFIRGWEAVLGVHQPVEVEPSDTICGGCSNRLPNGRYMPIVEFPCPTVRALEAVIGDE